MADLEVISLNDLPTNSFLVIRVDVPGPMEKYIAARDMAAELMRHKDVFKEKQVTIMIMTPKEGLEILTEAEMNSAGWFRKT